MTAAVGFPTLRLIRKSIGPYSLGDLAPGEHTYAEAVVDNSHFHKETASARRHNVARGSNKRQSATRSRSSAVKTKKGNAVSTKTHALGNVRKATQPKDK